MVCCKTDGVGYFLVSVSVEIFSYLHLKAVASVPLHLMEWTLEFINVPSCVRPVSSGALLHLYFILRFTSCTRTDTIFLFLIQASGGKMNE